MSGPEAALVHQEYRLAADLLGHACRHGLWLLGDPAAAASQSLALEAGELIARYQAVWLARNRPGPNAASPPGRSCWPPAGWPTRCLT
jgi:hypothetical protein